MWDAQLEMQHITGKLTDPKAYRPKAVIEREKREKEKAEKQRIRDELLTPTPVTDDD